MAGETPMMRQWSQIKRQYPDCIVLFRLGDFYEAFNEDAGRVAEICSVTLTSRPVARGERAPMAGVPYHAVDGYIAQLVRQGLKVAIVEQTGSETSPEKRARMSRVPDPPGVASESSPAKGGKPLMEREVVRVVTPGTLVEGELIDARTNLYLAGLVAEGERGLGLAHADLSTGEFATTSFTAPDAERQLLDELVRLRPAELIVAEAEREDPLVGRLRAAFAQLGLPTVIMPFAAWRFDGANARRALQDHFGTASLAAFGCEDRPLAARAAGAVMAYLKETQRGAVAQIGSLATYSNDGHMQLDAATRRNLELTGTLRGDQRAGSLLGLIDRSQTPMGARRLRAWLDRPLLDLERIERRLDAVALLAARARLRAEIRAELKGLPDIERLAKRVVAGYAGPRELLRLAEGLRQVPRLHRLLADVEESPGGDRRDNGRTGAEQEAFEGSAEDGRSEAHRAARSPDPGLRALCAQAVDGIALAIEAAIDPDAPAVLGVPGVIRAGFSEELDAIHASVAEARAWIAGLEAGERERTGIKRLKVGFNKVFGYYLEVPQAAADLVPADYHRKQTVTSGERYITPELKARESELLHAEERIVALERRLFRELFDQVIEAADTLGAAARDLAVLDAFAALAELAVLQRYIRPTLDADRAIEIRGGRHPVIEHLRSDPPFVPNDIRIGPGEIVLLTGPNMAGKSTIGRQIALTVLLAQIGSFVPADSARIGLVDRIFTRIGAQDELAAGQSTFMVEMVETAAILHQATPRSLIILDELGRGTSTYDGMAIAWAVIEHIHDQPRLGARTLFATHYHELTALAERLPRLRNANMAVAETEAGIAFLHRIEPGPADRSYGIHVADLAGLPREVIARAWAILERLETEGNVPLQHADDRPAARGGQLSLFAPIEPEHPALEALRQVDVDRLTPVEALVLLADLRAQARARRRP